MIYARLVYIALTIVTIVAGLTVHQHGLGLGSAPRDVIGDSMWAVMIVWWISVIAPRLSLRVRVIAALSICFMVEGSQLFHAPWLDMWRSTTPGRLTLGSGFDSRDLLAYTAGVLVAALIDRLVRPAFMPRLHYPSSDEF